MNPFRQDFADSQTIDAILKMKRIAVVGLTSNPSRPSYGVSKYMQRAGYEITPINPNEVAVLGEKAYGSLQELPEPPEVVDVFRRPEYLPEIVDDAIAAGAKAIWFQSGIINYAAAEKAKEAGLLVVMDRCMMVEHGARR